MLIDFVPAGALAGRRTRAITEQATYLPAQNTLGVIYKQHGNLAEAALLFQRILVIEPENYVALSNQVLVLRAMGRHDDANRAGARLKLIRPMPPFQYFDQGVVAMKCKDFAEGKRLFVRSLQRDAFTLARIASGRAVEFQ